MKLPRLVLALQWLRAVAALADTPVEDDDEIIPGAYIVEFDAPQVSTSISLDVEVVGDRLQSFRVLVCSMQLWKSGVEGGRLSRHLGYLHSHHHIGSWLQIRI